MNVPFYGHVRQYHNIQAEIDANIHEVLESGQYVMGPMLQRFEKEFANYHGMKYAVGVGNGTDALWLAFQALGIGPGDECIPSTVSSFDDLGERISLSRTHLIRKLRMAESMGSLGWLGERGKSTMWVSAGFVREYHTQQSIKLAIIDSAVHRVFAPQDIAGNAAAKSSQ